jgi:lipoprotein NlpI
MRNDQVSYRIRSHAKSSLKDRSGALADMDKAVELSPQNATVYTDRASIRLIWDDYDGANADLEKAFTINPNLAFNYLTRGLLERKRGDNNGALADFSRAVKLDPRSAENHQALGYLQSDLFQWRPALESLRKTLELDPGKDYALFHIYLIRSQLDEQEDAKKELEAHVKSLQGTKKQDWPASIGHFLTGTLPENEFLTKATTTAKRPTDINEQICEADYYSGMKHLLNGDREGASVLFKKCLNTDDKNCFEYMSAGVELLSLEKP